MSELPTPDSSVDDPRDGMPSTADDEEAGYGGEDGDEGDDEYDEDSEFGHA